MEGEEKVLCAQQIVRYTGMQQLIIFSVRRSFSNLIILKRKMRVPAIFLCTIIVKFYYIAEEGVMFVLTSTTGSIFILQAVSNL